MLTQISEGLRIFRHSVYLKLFSHDKYLGSPQDICKKVVDDCWNSREKYFMTSTGNFAQFWSRDFGICTEALVKQGYKLEVAETLEYALARFQKAGRITTTITPGGKPYDFPGFASDSLPFMIRSLKIAGSKKLIKKYRSFLLDEIKRYFEIIFDPETGMVRSDRSFSSMKDYSKRKSSAYDNSMAAMLSMDLDELGLSNPFKGFDIRKRMKKELWNGKFFYDDMNKIDNAYGDANVFPFWTGVFKDKKMFESCLKHIKKADLDRPFPLKYSGKRKIKGQRMVWQELVVGDYERDSVWMNVGLCFLDCLARFEKKKELERYVKQYSGLVEKHKNFLEVYDHKGRPFRNVFYRCDAGMLWAVNMIKIDRY
ncbi:MAG: hypothetical protein KKE20_06050 [Nanoarchaeota archaeon]|nr:hypothetical protein [Nanoarchaeota archaeon]